MGELEKIPSKYDSLVRLTSLDKVNEPQKYIITREDLQQIDGHIWQEFTERLYSRAAELGIERLEVMYDIDKDQYEVWFWKD